MDQLEPAWRTFLHTYVTSFTRWDLLRFFMRQPERAETLAHFAQHVGREPRRVEPDVQAMVTNGILEQFSGNPVTYRVTNDPRFRSIIEGLVRRAEQDRAFRLELVYYIVHHDEEQISSK